MHQEPSGLFGARRSQDNGRSHSLTRPNATSDAESTGGHAGILEREIEPYVGPRMRIRGNEELRMRVDVDPDGNSALRVELFADSDTGPCSTRGPLWINPHALKGLRADFDF
jgi:hypothetical protein